MSEKKDLVLNIDQYWRINLTGIDETAGTVDNLVIDRVDGNFFKIILTRVLGYIFPMIFEKRNDNDISGTICLLVRTSLGGKKYVVVERKKVINWRGEVEERLRACRSSVSSPDGSSIPAGSRKPFVHDLGIVELNDMRIAGPTRCFVVEQPWFKYLEAGQELMSFSQFAKSHDAPGKNVLFAYEHL